MTVEDLMSLLEECDPAAEVRLAHQPNYPLWVTLGGVAASDDYPEVFLLEDANGETGYAEPELWNLAMSPGATVATSEGVVIAQQRHIDLTSEV